MQRHLLTLAAGLLLGCLASGCSRAITSANSVATQPPANPADLKAYILKESQPGGKLDFFTPIKGHEHDGRQIKPGVYASGIEFALYSWGHAVRDLGVNSLEEAYTIYSELKGQPASMRDKATIKLGFNKELDN